MFGHFPELIIILILALVFFGPEKLPEIAGSAGKMMAELRAAMDAAMHPDTEIQDDEFATYYYDSLERSGEEDVELEDLPDPADDVDYSGAGDDEIAAYSGAEHYGAEHDVTGDWQTQSGSHPVSANGSADSITPEAREHHETV